MKENYTKTSMCNCLEDLNYTERVHRYLFDNVQEFEEELDRLDKMDNFNVCEIFVTFYVDNENTVSFRFSCIEQAICNTTFYAIMNDCKLFECVLIEVYKVHV